MASSQAYQENALDVHSGLSDEPAMDYDWLQKALLQRYMTSQNGAAARESEELSWRDKNLLVSSVQGSPTISMSWSN